MWKIARKYSIEGLENYACQQLRETTTSIRDLECFDYVLQLLCYDDGLGPDSFPYKHLALELAKRGTTRFLRIHAEDFEYRMNQLKGLSKRLSVASKMITVDVDATLEAMKNAGGKFGLTCPVCRAEAGPIDIAQVFSLPACKCAGTMSKDNTTAARDVYLQSWCWTSP